MGRFGLVAICFVAATVTWTYLVGASSQSAAAATAAPSVSHVPTVPFLDTSAFQAVSLSARSAIVVDETTGQVLYALNPDAQWPLASLTKVALVLSVAEALPGDTIVSIPFDTGYNSHATGMLLRGERWRLQDVIDFTLAVSSNQGADILAQVANSAIHQAFPLSPPQGAAVWRMNDLVRSLGLVHTYYLNDNGLDESPTQAGAFGSARDMAALFAYAATHMPETFSATTRSAFDITSLSGREMKASNTDDALPDLPGVILGKTGYTDLAGGNLAVCFVVHEHMICAVVLGSTFDGRFSDMKTLAATVDAAFSSP